MHFVTYLYYIYLYMGFWQWLYFNKDQVLQFFVVVFFQAHIHKTCCISLLYNTHQEWKKCYSWISICNSLIYSMCFLIAVLIFFSTFQLGIPIHRHHTKCNSQCANPTYVSFPTISMQYFYFHLLLFMPDVNS